MLPVMGNNGIDSYFFKDTVLVELNSIRQLRNSVQHISMFSQRVLCSLSVSQTYVPTFENDFLFYAD